MDREQQADAIFRDYLERVDRGEALDLKAFFSRYGDLEEALWERFWTWEEARTVFKSEPSDDDGASILQSPELFFAFREEHGEEFGRRIGEFTLIKEIGRGTMGVVFLARQEVTDRLVALKLLSPLRHKSPTARERFRREVAALGRLNHPHIVSILTAGDVEGIPYFAMELVCGVQLDELLTALKRREILTITGAHVGDFIEENIPEYMKPFVFPALGGKRSDDRNIFGRPYVEVACRFAIHLAEALDHAHSQGVLHRDVKPSNVLVDVTGSCRLSDFGLARELGTSALTKSGELVGTPFYAAPEQLAGARTGQDGRADIFSLGVTLYELLCLTVPFTGDNPQQVFNQILVKDARPPHVHNPGVPQELETIVAKCLEKDPDHRYQRASELAEDLTAFLEFRPIKAKPAGPVRGAIKLIRRQRLVAGALGVALVAVLILAAFMIKLRWDELAAQAGLEERINNEIVFIEAALGAGSLQDAGIHFERLLGLDDSHPRLDELRQQIAMLRCQSHLDEARLLGGEFQVQQQRWIELEKNLAELERTIAAGYTTMQERLDAHDLKRRLQGIEVSLAEMEENKIYAMNAARAQAAAAGQPDYPPVLQAFAEHFMERWEDALDAGDVLRMEHYAQLVRQYDRRQLYTTKLEGLATLAVDGTPNAEVYLFRYESYRKVSRTPGTDRLVPVPSRGEAALGPVEIAPGFYPGDPALYVLSGGLTELQPGDLILSINGRPAAETLFVRSVRPNSPAAGRGVQPFFAISKVQGLEQINSFTWTNFEPGAECTVETTSGGRTILVPCADRGESLTRRTGIECAAAAELLAEAVAPFTIALKALRGRDLLAISVRAGEVAGIRSEATAYPLICSQENLLGSLPFKSITCAPGAYLLLFRLDGMEDLRLPVHVPRLKVTRAVGDELKPEGTTPPGFVRVAGGEFVRGGDREALWPEDKITVFEKEFWIARGEVTVGEWFEFVNQVIPDADVAEADRLLPRYAIPDYEHRASQPPIVSLSQRNPETGLLEPKYWIDPRTPVVGVSLNDVAEFLEWKNDRARRNGDPWVYDLPTWSQWEKAARGVDERAYPWGDRFDYTFCKSAFAHPREARTINSFLGLEAGLSYPKDESPYGVRDLAGSVVEWNKDRFRLQQSIRGGSFDGKGPNYFRAASRDDIEAGMPSHNLGFRLTARPAP